MSALSIREDVRAAISDAYYEARNNHRTMEQAADDATAGVLAVIAALADDESLAERVVRAWAGGAWEDRPGMVRKANVTRARRWLRALAAALTERSS